MGKRGVALLAAILAGLVVGVGCGGDSQAEDGGDITVGQTTTLNAGADSPDATAEPTSIEDLSKLPALRRSSENDVLPAIRGSAGLSLPQWLHTVDGDIVAFWDAAFDVGGLRYSSPRETIFDRPVRTPCGRAQAGQSAFYCGRNQAVYIDLPYEQVRFNRFGDTAPAISVAHENGHHIQLLLGVNPNRLGSHDFELQADCLAGVWASSVGQRGLLEEGDLDEAIYSRAAVGDPAGTDPNDPQAHGAGPERARSFLKGYRSGRAVTCLR
jgi:predicted metalloprotease